MELINRPSNPIDDMQYFLDVYLILMSLDRIYELPQCLMNIF